MKNTLLCTIALLLLLLGSSKVMADNDELAFEFINSEPEAIQVASECLDKF